MNAYDIIDASINKFKVIAIKNNKVNIEGDNNGIF